MTAARLAAPRTGGRGRSFQPLGTVPGLFPLAECGTGPRALPYSTVGVLQYITPSLQLVCGIALYRESFGPAQAAGFALLWVALLIYAADGLWRARSAAKAATA